MTPQPQESKEYFTLEQLQSVIDVVRSDAVYDDDVFYFKVDVGEFQTIVHSLVPIRSRPTPAPAYSASLTSIEIALRKEENPSDNIQWAIEKLNQYQENQEQHDAAVAAQAREKALDELIETIKEDFTEDFDGELTITYGDFLFNVQSLRTQQEHP